MPFKRFIPGLCLSAAALFACIGSATTLQKLELAEMVEAADAIVIGYCRTAETIWVGRSLYTRYTVEVEDALLGGSSQVSVVVPGGIDFNRVHPIAMAVPGAPTMTNGDYVALLLEQTHFPYAGDYAIVGFNQGRIRIDAPTAGTGLAANAGGAGASARAAAVRGAPDAAVQRLVALVETRGRTQAATGTARRDVSRLPRAGGAGVAR